MKYLLLSRTMSILLCCMACYAPTMAQLSFKVEETYNWEFKGRSSDQWPEILGHGDNYIVTQCIRPKSFKGFIPFIEKRSISTGELFYKVEFKTSKFRKLRIFHEDTYFENGNTHLLYRTKKEDGDSLYLLDYVITANGALQEPRVLIAGWMEDDKDSPTMTFSWNETRSGLTAMATQKGKKGKIIYRRRTFDAQLHLIKSKTFTGEAPFGNVRIIEYQELHNAGYLLTFTKQGKGGMLSMLRINDAEMKATNVRVQHPHISGLTIHKQGENVYLSYLSFKDKNRKSIQGYHASLVSFEGNQKWVTNYAFDEEFLDFVDSFDNWIHKDRGRFSIKQIVEHPKGGHVITLHKTYALETNYSVMPSYNSNDHVLLYVNQANEVKWVRFIPARVSTTNISQLNNLTGFTPDGAYVSFILNNAKNTQDWNTGSTKVRLLKRYAITAAMIPPDGEINFKNVYQEELQPLVPATSNMSRISPDSREYYMFRIASGWNSQLVKVSISGLEPDGEDPVYELLKYGRQE